MKVNNMKKIAISGCGGYIGSYAIRYFINKGYQVRGMDNFFKGHCDSLFNVIDNPNFEFFRGDVTNLNDCKRLVKDADYIIHLASLVGFPICSSYPDLAYSVNVNGTKNILEARYASQKLFFASTGSVYGKLEEVCTEDSPCNTNTVYGKTKLEAENLITSQPNTVSFRFATCAGLSPCMRVELLVHDFIYNALTSKSIVVFEPDARRTFIHISDFVKSIEFALKNEMEYKVYNAGSDTMNWSKRKLAEYIKEKTGCHLFYGETGKDLDQRDYEVSYARLNNQGFVAEKSMEFVVEEIIKATPLIRIGNRYEPNK